MRRRTFLLGGLGGAGLVALGACSGGDDDDSPTGGPEGGDATAPAPRPTLRLAGGDVGFPSPFAYRRGGGYVMATMIYDTLVWKDSTGEILPWLAESFESSDDALTHTFTLQSDLSWHDGVR